MPLCSTFKTLARSVPHATIVVLCVLFCWTVVPAAAQSNETSSTDTLLRTLRLRFAWGGGQPRQWNGRLTIDGGELTGLQLLGRESDTPGSIDATDGGIDIHQPAPRRLDGFDVTANFPPGGVVRLELQSAEATVPRVVLIRYEDLLEKPQRVDIDESQNGSQNVLLVHRVANDTLRLTTDRDTRLFSPGEKFAFAAQLAVHTLDTDDLKLRATLLDAAGNAIAEQSPPITPGQSVPLAFDLPEAAGIYRIRLSVIKPPVKNFRVPFLNDATPQTIVERIVEIAVLAKTVPQFESVDAWPVLLDVDPTSSTWPGRLPDWVWLKRLPHMPKGPVGNRAPTIVPIASGRGVQLQPGSENVPGDWQAYPLPVLSVGIPHVVEVDVPTDTPQQIALRVFEPGADGLLVPVGRGLVCYRDEPNRDASQAGVETLRYLFWPSTTSATLVVQAAGEDPANFSHVRLRAAQYTTAAPSEWKQPTSRSRTAVVDNPFWARDFLASSIDTPSGVSDHYTAATRLADWLVLDGYDSVALPVYYQGGLLARIDGLPSTPLLCKECLDTSTSDLPPCDALQILLDVCQSRRLRVTPILEFNAAIPQLEAALRAGDRAIELIDAAGLPWTDFFSTTSIRRRYDPHHPLVQETIAAAAGSLAKRYGQHPAFGGIAVTLDGGSSTIPAGSYWGLHRESLRRFEHEQSLSDEQTQLIDSDPLNLLRNEALRNQWAAWRGEQTAKLYETIRQRVGESSESDVLFLCHRTLEDVEFGNRLRPPVGAPANLAGWMTDHGMPKQYLDEITIQRAVPRDFAPTTRFDFTPSMLSDAINQPSDRQVATTQTVSDAIEVATPTGDSGGLLKFAPNSSQAVPLVAVDDEGRRLLTESLSAYDAPHRLVTLRCAATTLMPVSAERELWKQLPTEGEVTRRVQQPVWVKSIAGESQTTLIASNNSAWPIEAAVTIDVASRTNATDLTRLDDAPVAYSNGRHIWKVMLGPYESIALRFDSSDVTVLGIGLKQSPAYRADLAARIASLEQHSLNSPSDYHPLDNLSMERTLPDGKLAGWTMSASGNSAIKIDTISASDGSQSALLASTDGTVSLASDYFRNPGTGQLAVTANANIENIQDDATLMMIVENETGTYRQHALLSAERLRADASLQKWNSYTLGLEDVPFIKSERLRIRFELRGEASVRIDAIEIQPLVFPLERYQESKQQIVALASIAQLARKRLDEGDVTSCEVILDGYWARYITQHLPKIAPVPLASEPPPDAQPEERPRVTGRLRDYLPSVFR